MSIFICFKLYGGPFTANLDRDPAPQNKKKTIDNQHPLTVKEKFLLQKFFSLWRRIAIDIDCLLQNQGLVGEGQFADDVHLF